MKNRGLIIAGIVTLVFIILSKKRALDSMELKPGFPRKFQFIPLANVQFELPITAFNGSSGTLNIGSIDLRVYAENQYVGRAWTGANQKIYPNGQSELLTTVLVNLFDMASAIPGFLEGIKDQTVTLRFTGNLNIEGFYKDVNIPVTFNLPKIK